MDADASPPPSISTHLRHALNSCRSAWRNAARLVLDVALLTLCVACREPVDGEGVCAQCWSKLSFIARPFCPRLGIPFVYDPGPELLSMEAIASPPAYARARAAVRYDDVAKTLVHALKYQDRTDLAPAMGRWMARAGQELLNEADWLIPVPLHWRRAWSRRYNQSGALARDRTPKRCQGQRGVAPARPRDRAAGQAVAATARQQCAGRIQGIGRAPIRGPGPPCGPDRRCPDVRRHGRCLRAGIAARQSRYCRRAGVRPGCGYPPPSHIIG